ncbi:MAG: hypothetical protein IKB86_08010 [Clostridia bacterium]|nr:hypothetical protein [Clostridia bacterium]
MFDKIHSYRKNENLARKTNAVYFDDSWSVVLPDFADKVLKAACEDFSEYFSDSFDLKLGNSTDKRITFALCEGEYSFRISVSENEVKISAKETFLLAQGLFYCEDLMNLCGQPCLEKKDFNLTQRVRDRLVYLGEFDNFDEYILKLLHFGYNGIIFDSYEKEFVKTAKEYGFKTFMFLIDNEGLPFDEFDGIILQEEPTEKDLISFKGKNVIYSTEFWSGNFEAQKEILAGLPQNATVLVPFDANQLIEKDGVKCITKSGSLIQPSASQYFEQIYAFCREQGINVMAITFSAGRTNEFGSIPYIPAMMQWLLRNEALKDFDVAATVESGKYGFIPSIVAEFTKGQLYFEALDGGIYLQQLAGEHFGNENIEKIVMVFKKLSDAANYLIINKADISGPLMFGPAYPLTDSEIYDFPFAQKDITYETDCNLKAADCFMRASAILSHIDNKNAKELMYICLFAVNSLVTSANAKRWYRRLYASKTMDLDFKKKFVLEQMVKIGEEEISNAFDTLEILEKAPFLCGNKFEELCSVDALEAKVTITRKAIQKIKEQIETIN